jgi:diketogulonate reductase-like aldo/keto reductase
MLPLLLLANLVPSTPEQRYTRLNTGQLMPLVNLGGTAPSIKPGDHYSNYTEFVRQGGRGLDTALTYTDGINAQVADALEAYPATAPRSAVWVTTKVPCCPGPAWMKWCGMEEYNGTVAQSMARNNALLRLNASSGPGPGGGGGGADVTLLHHACDTAEQTIQRWVELEAAQRAGLTRAIGVSNFDAALLAALAADPRTSVTPAVNQCNHAIGNHNASHAPADGGDDGTVAYCKAHNISYSAYSPLEGLNGQDVFNNPTVLAVAAAHNASGAQVALKWLTQQDISVVTAAHDPAFIGEDIDLWSFGELTPQEMATLAAI